MCGQTCYELFARKQSVVWKVLALNVRLEGSYLFKVLGHGLLPILIHSLLFQDVHDL